MVVRATVTLSDAGGASSSASAVTGPITGAAGGLPGTPTGAFATSGPARASVSFTAPAADGGSPIVAYRVTASPGGRTAVGASSPVVVDGLTRQPYTFTVTATNLTGDGPPSAPSNAVKPAGVPGAATSLLATAADGRATVAFTPPADDGGAAITGYTATAAPGGRSGTSTGGPITVPGLTNGVSYTFTVTAANAVGPGPASTPSGAVTPESVERPHEEPPPPSPRPDIPVFAAPGPRPPPPPSGF
jgi:hypothetical protein